MTVERMKYGGTAASMDELLVRDLVQHGEKMSIEFKGERRQSLSDSDLVDAVVCLGNVPAEYDRSVLLIGVEDNGTVTGARARHGATTNPDRLRAMIFGNTEPALDTRVTVVPLAEGDVIVVEISRQVNVCASKQGKATRRAQGVRGPECVPFYPHEHQSHRSDLGLIDVSAQPLDAVEWRDLDPIEIDRMRKTIEQLRGDRYLTALDDEELAKALGLVETRGGRLVPTVTGLLVVGRQEVLNRVIPNHAVEFQVLGPSGDVVANDSLQGPLLQTLEAVEQRFVARNSEREILVGLVRLPIPDYAPDAFREALNNAVLHRDYSQNNAVYVQWHSDRLLITNPGGFPRGITLENLLVHEPTPRNPRLADVFRRLGLIERTGRGIDKIFSGQLRYGRPVPDYSQSDALSVRITMSSSQASLEFARFVFEQQGIGRLLGVDHLLVLDQLRRERRTNAVVAGKVIQKNDHQTRAVLEQLVEWGIAEARGERRGRVYLLSAAVYRQLGESAGYVRTRGFDRIQREAMVLEFVRAHGVIRRVDVAELCSLTPDEATRLLGGMTDRGLLERQGTRRGSHYLLASQQQ